MLLCKLMYAIECKDYHQMVFEREHRVIQRYILF